MPRRRDLGLAVAEQSEARRIEYVGPKSCDSQEATIPGGAPGSCHIEELGDQLDGQARDPLGYRVPLECSYHEVVRSSRGAREGGRSCGKYDGFAVQARACIADRILNRTRLQTIRHARRAESRYLAPYRVAHKPRAGRVVLCTLGQSLPYGADIGGRNRPRI